MRPRVLLLLAGLAVLSVAASLLAGPHLAGLVMGGAEHLRQAGLAGLSLFAAICFVFALAGIVPGALVGLAAGVVFGLAEGFAVAAIGIMAGAVAAFCLSRSFFRPLIAALLARYGALARLDTMLRGDGWRLVALLRVSPVMPFSLTSYALGLSAISFKDYLLGTCASLPALLGYVALGALGGAGARLRPGAGRDIHLGLLLLGTAATLALTVHIGRLLGRALKPTSV